MPKKHKTKPDKELPYWESKVKEETERPRWKTSRWKFSKPANVVSQWRTGSRP